MPVVDMPKEGLLYERCWFHEDSLAVSASLLTSEALNPYSIPSLLTDFLSSRARFSGFESRRCEDFVASLVIAFDIDSPALMCLYVMFLPVLAAAVWLAVDSVKFLAITCIRLDFKDL